MTQGSNTNLDERGLILACPQCGKRNRLSYERLGQTFRCGGCHKELPPPSAAIDITSDYQFQSLAAHSALPILIDFWAPWCGPCKMVAPEVAKVAATANGAFLVAKVNTDDCPRSAEQFQISSIPTFVVVKEGHELARKSGALSANAIRQFLSQISA